MAYNNLYFGETINDFWNLLEVLDENNKPTEYIAVRGEFWSDQAEDHFKTLIKSKKVIGLSSYQSFPRWLNNPHENRGPEKTEGTFIKKYGDIVIFWCHCFKNPKEFLPETIPRMLYSETDQYQHVNTLVTIANNTRNNPKKYDFFLSLQEGEWNSHIRGLDIAKKWLNFMADKMHLKILVCGNNRRPDFSSAIDVVDFQPWDKFIEFMNSSKYLFCTSKYDASPRIIVEALSLGMPVLLNENILGGWKYINDKTGLLFFPDEIIENKINLFLKNAENNEFNTIKWVKHNVDREKNSQLLANSLRMITGLRYEDFIDGIMYINLENRKDRNEEILKQLTNMQVPMNMVHRIDAFYNETCGHLGCTMSHIKCLDFAKENKWERFLILEDDFTFSFPKERFLFVLSSLYKFYDWDVFMLSTYWKEHCDTNCDYIKKIVYGTTAPGYLVNSMYCETLYNNFVNSCKLLENEVDVFKQNNPNKKMYETSNALDQKWFELQRKDNFYVSEPNIGKQSGSVSSIMS